MLDFIADAMLKTVLNMSLTASIVILFVLAARLLLSKAPKLFSYALWSVVLFRLLCPVSLTAELSLLGLFDSEASPITEHTSSVEYLPRTEPAVTMPTVRPPDAIDSLPVVSPDNGGIVTMPIVPENEGIVTPPHESPEQGVQVPVEPPVKPLLPEEKQPLSMIKILAVIWLVGILAMLSCSVVAYLRLRRRLIGAVQLKGNIYLADHIGSPFVMGLLRPKIYLPSVLSERERKYILLHEQYHIRRMDHIIKALAFLALCVHWFNPLVWLAFILASKDMEMSCDEAVMKTLGKEIRTEYSASLLSLATGRRMISGTPLTFGEGDTKSRIRNVLRWKKPGVWILLTAAVLCAACVVFCALNPVSKAHEQNEDVQTDIPSEDPGKDNMDPTEETGNTKDPDDPTQINCGHSGFSIAFDSQPTRFTVVDWFYDHGLLEQCDICGKNPYAEYTQTAFSDCLEGLKSGKYDVVLIPCSSATLSQLDGYRVVPVQRDAVIFVRSNSAELYGYDLTDDEIRRAFTGEETVYWDETLTDAIIPASGHRDSATLWQQIYTLFGFAPTSPNVIFTGEGQDNAPMAIEDSGRSGSGLWPYYFSCRNGEAALNGEIIAVNGVYPSAATIADGSYPYAFTYYAVYAPDNSYAAEIEAFASEVQALKFSLFETSDTLRFLPGAWERSFNRNDETFSLVGTDEAGTYDVVVNGLLLQTLSLLYDQIELPANSDAVELLPGGLEIEIKTDYLRTLRIARDEKAPWVWLYLQGPAAKEVSVVYSPQMYTYLTALAEKENAALEDPDSDGFFEVLIWDYSRHDLVIYDYYEDSIHRISTNEAIGCEGSDYAGLIANILPQYRNMIQAQDESGKVSVYRYKNGGFSYVCPLSTALGQGGSDTEQENDSLQVFSGTINSGFIYCRDGSVVAVGEGEPVKLSMQKEKKTILRNGTSFTVEYSWVRYGNTLAARADSGYYSVVPLTGSDRYLELILDMGYTYLIDTITGEVLDPFSALDRSITDYLGIVNFSSDGQYAVISYNGSTQCVVLDCVTGEALPMFAADDAYSVSGFMLDPTHVLFILGYELEEQHRFEYSVVVYDLDSGAYSGLSDRYTARDSSAKNFLCMIGNGSLAYTYENGYLVIVDVVTWERMPTTFRKGSVSRVFYWPDALVGIVSDDVFYVIREDAQAYAVCGIE